MGIHNVQAVGLLAAEKGVGHAAARLALNIAAYTLDHDGDDGHPRGLYYMGRDAMALHLGIMVAHYDDSEDGRRAKKGAHAAVKRAVRELIDAGILELVEVGSGHRRSRYRLLVEEVARRPQRPREPVGSTWNNDF
jgi:hypothetical protein